MAGIKQYLEIHSAALGLRNKKNEIIASNIANAATPNYKARDLDFNSEMSRHLKTGNLTTTNEKHFSLMRQFLIKVFPSENLFNNLLMAILLN